MPGSHPALLFPRLPSTVSTLYGIAAGTAGIAADPAVPARGQPAGKCFAMEQAENQGGAARRAWPSRRSAKPIFSPRPVVFGLLRGEALACRGPDTRLHPMISGRRARPAHAVSRCMTSMHQPRIRWPSPATAECGHPPLSPTAEPPRSTSSRCMSLLHEPRVRWPDLSGAGLGHRPWAAAAKRRRNATPRSRKVRAAKRISRVGRPSGTRPRHARETAPTPRDPWRSVGAPRRTILTLYSIVARPAHPLTRPRRCGRGHPPWAAVEAGRRTNSPSPL